MVAGGAYGPRSVTRLSEVGAHFPGNEETSPVLKRARSNPLRTFWFGSQSPLPDERDNNPCKGMGWGWVVG